jgi:signal transduction histidine kinase
VHQTFSAATETRPDRLRGRELLRAVAEGTAGVIGDEFLRSLVRCAAEAFGARIAFVGEAIDTRGGRVQVLACWNAGRFEEPFEYVTEGTPCALLPEHPAVTIPEALTSRFPEDHLAIELGVESYVAVCLRGADGSHLGHLAVLDARPMEAGEEDVAALKIFASRAAAELERRRHAAALAASRARVIEAADVERRRVGRDLHDGAQQRLLAVSNLLRIARSRLAAAPSGDAAADSALERAADELAQAHRELRELARGLHPVALAERGLPDALVSLTATANVPVDLDVCDDPLPEAVATGAYFIVAECMANAVRHADAASISVRVSRSAAALEIEVADDGCGGADAAAGTGLRGLADRVEVLGGRLEVASPPGQGTRVTATIALRADD